MIDTKHIISSIVEEKKRKMDNYFNSENNNNHQIIPQWQKDMARWAMRREIYSTCDFKDYSPRKGFYCREYFTNKDLIK